MTCYIEIWEFLKGSISMETRGLRKASLATPISKHFRELFSTKRKLFIPIAPYASKFIEMSFLCTLPAAAFPTGSKCHI